MASYNGLVASFNGQVTIAGGTGFEFLQVSDFVPAKLFRNALFTMKVDTLSAGSTFTARVVGAVGGCTAVFAQLSSVNSAGNYVFGTTGEASYLVPRPAYAHLFFQAASGVTANLSINMAGTYNA